MSDEHSEALTSKSVFCSTPGEPCSCGNNYRKVCEPGWSSLKYPEKHAELGGVNKSYEAHHILCVAQVGNHIDAPKSDFGYEAALNASKWCINDKGNMIALPRWGHTIMWYCRTAVAAATVLPSGSIANPQQLQPNAVGLIRPPFKDLPQHDYGHRGKTYQGYEEEVGAELEKLANSLEKAKKVHNNQVLNDIAPRLRGMSSTYRSKLLQRAKRSHGGTHGAWLKASKNPTDQTWYKSFSMAPQPAPMTFPGSFNEGLGRKIIRIAKALFNMPATGL